jgi:hypothetical protein
MLELSPCVIEAQRFTRANVPLRLEDNDMPLANRLYPRLVFRMNVSIVDSLYWLDVSVGRNLKAKYLYTQDIRKSFVCR